MENPFDKEELDRSFEILDSDPAILGNKDLVQLNMKNL